VTAANLAVSPAPVAAAPAPPRRTALFVREFLRDPLTTASLVPSSRALAEAMMPTGGPLGVVVELGPGSGAFTMLLQERTPIRHLGIELNAVLARQLAGDFPMMEVETAAADGLEGSCTTRISTAGSTMWSADCHGRHLPASQVLNSSPRSPGS